MRKKLELCCECGQPTGKAGILDDSLYIDGEGPFCDECYPVYPAPNEVAPLFWYRPCSDGTYDGPLYNSNTGESKNLSKAWVPLYADIKGHPPLTDVEIDAIMTPLTKNVSYSWRKFARAIEAAHGIGEANEKVEVPTP